MNDKEIIKAIQKLVDWGMIVDISINKDGAEIRCDDNNSQFCADAESLELAVIHLDGMLRDTIGEGILSNPHARAF